MKTTKVKHTWKKFKIGDLEFLVDAFHPLNFEKGVYAVSTHQDGKPMLDKYTYFIQVEAKNGLDAIDRAKHKINQNKTNLNKRNKEA